MVRHLTVRGDLTVDGTAPGSGGYTQTQFDALLAAKVPVPSGDGAGKVVRRTEDGLGWEFSAFATDASALTVLGSLAEVESAFAAQEVGTALLYRDAGRLMVQHKLSSTGRYNFSIATVDVTAPVITINGGDVTVAVGATYADAGATATDDGASLAVTTTFTAPDGAPATSVDTSIVGVWTVTYTATDAFGNSATTARTVTVE